MSIHSLSRASALSRVPAVPAGGQSLWRRVWGALERAGMHRARHELAQLASAYDHSRPDLARQLREASRHTLDA